MQIVQLVGAGFILVAFGLTQTGRIQPGHYVAIYFNLAGALMLATSAYAAEQWGFVLLNAAWTLVAVFGLFRRIVAH